MRLGFEIKLQVFSGLSQFILVARESSRAKMNGLRERVFAAWRSGKAPSPATEALGISILRLAKGRSVMEMNVSEKFHNLSGTMHGGIMSDIADAAMGIALATTLSPGEDFTTIEFKMSFLRPPYQRCPPC